MGMMVLVVGVASVWCTCEMNPQGGNQHYLSWIGMECSCGCATREMGDRASDPTYYACEGLVNVLFMSSLRP